MFCKAKSRTFGKDQLSYFFGTTVTFFAVLDDEVIAEIAKKNNCTPGQVCIAWLAEKKISVLIKSENQQRLKENMEGLKVQLDQEDIQRLDGLNKLERTSLDPYDVL